MMVRQSALRTNHLMCSKAFWCSAVQVGKTWSHSFVVRGVSTLVYLASAGRKLDTYRVRPKKPRTLVAVIGWGHVAMQSVLQGSGLMPIAETTCSRKESSVVKRFDLAWLQ